MSAGFRAGDVEGAHAQRGDGSELAGELERISGAVQALGERSDEAGVPVFPQEIEEVMDMLESLAREATAHSVAGRPEAQGLRPDNLGDRVAAADRDAGFRLTAMEARLEEIAGAVDRLPRSLPLRPLEDKLKMLATAVEHFVSRPPSVGPETFAQIEVRLDEISRAIVASAIAAQSPQVDPEPFERIEARIAALARQIEEVTADRRSGELIERLDALSERIEGMALRTEMPARSLQLLSGQIADIAGKVDRASSCWRGSFPSGIEPALRSSRERWSAARARRPSRKA